MKQASTQPLAARHAAPAPPAAGTSVTVTRLAPPGYPCGKAKLKAFPFTLIAFATMSLFIASIQRAVATIVPITGMFPETVIASFTSTVAHDVVINADMLKDASGGSGVIKAVAWSSQSSTSKFGGFFVEDFNGTSVTIPLQTNGIQPDIVLSYNNGAGISNPYQALIVYCVGQRAILDIYDLQDVGLSTFNIPTTPSFSTILSTTCDGFPHIDMFLH